MTNEIVVLDTTGELARCVLVSGPDFVATLASRPTGAGCAGSSGTTPTCPGTAPSWVGRGAGTPVGPDGAPGWWRAARTGGRAATADESAGASPVMAADGSLWFVSDRTGWWNLYRQAPGGEIEAQGPDRGRDRPAGSGCSASRSTPSWTTARVVFA